MPNALSFRSLRRRLLTVWVFLAAATASLFAQSPSAADGFDPNVNGNVYATVVDGVGRIILGGQFSTVQPNGAVFATTRNNLVRLNADGSVDATLDLNINGPVRAIVLQPDGSLVIGGDFTSITPAGGAAVTRNRVARITAAGALDTSFSPGFTGDLQPQVLALARQADGAIIVGGVFSRATSSASATVVNRRNLARVTAAGAVDATWDPNPNGVVLALAMHSAGRVVVGGGFTTFQANGATTTITRNRLARLNTNGTVDDGFDPNANNGVAAITVQRDGKILVGGFFTTLQSPDWSSAITRNHFARLEDDGRIDVAFESNASGNVTAIAVQPDGGILIGGPFSAVWSHGSATVSKAFIARFLPDATVDATFNAGTNADVSAIAVQPDGKVIIGGYFTRTFPFNNSITGILARNHVARIYPNGEVDATFALDAGGRPLVTAVQADGKIIIGGSFTSVGGATHTSLARINPDGTVDPGYNPTFDSRIVALALQADGKLLVGGTFLTVNGQTRNHLARLNADGTLDTAFNPNVDGPVGVITLQSDGKILIGGAFNTLQPPSQTTAIIRSHIARLTAAGEVDTPFDPSTDNTVTSIIVQSDGKILLAGAFTALQPNGAAAGLSRGHIARVNADGTADNTLTIGFDGQISAMVLQSDGKLVVGGQFTLAALPNATEATKRNRLARLNTDGTLDASYDPNANGNVLALALQSDGKLLVGGSFTTLQPNGAADWTLRKYAARLNTDGTVDAGFNLDISEALGNRVDSWRILSDGRVLVGGLFTSLQPTGTARVARRNFARLTAAGLLDATFDIGAGGSTAAQVNAIAIQTDGRVVVGGKFTDLGGAKTTNLARFTAAGLADVTFGSTLTTDGEVTAVAIRPTVTTSAPQLGSFAWLNTNGSLRTSFGSDANARLVGQVTAVVFDSQGRMLVAGAFTNRTAVTNGNLLRFSASGVLDTNFNPNINGQVSTVALQSDGKILIGGVFTTVNSLTRDRIARLNDDGSVDSAYDPNASSNVNSIIVQPDGKALIAGAFTTLSPNGATTPTNRSYLARLNVDGTVDAYNPTPGGPVNGMALQSDGKLVIGGSFTFLNPNASTTSTTRNFLARINTDGTLDTAFDPNFNNVVNTVAIQPNGDIVVGGVFTSYEPSVNGSKVTGFPGTFITRIKADGSPDRTFFPIPNGVVSMVAIQPDGGILLGGLFTTIKSNGDASPAIARNHLARLNADGTTDLSFNPDIAGAVYFVGARPDNSVLVGGDFTALQGNGLLIVGGSFDNVGGIPTRRLAFVNEDGSINSAFSPNPNGNVNFIVTQADGRFVVAGDFTTIAGVARNRIARFNVDGTLDSSFAPSPLTRIGALALQSDGKVLAAVGSGVTRYNVNGTVDPTFAPAVNNPVTGLAVQPDGGVIYVLHDIASLNDTIGRFTPAGAIDTNFQKLVTIGVRSLAVQSDGRILAAVTMPGVIPTLVRLNPDGTQDATFNPMPNGPVSALAIQQDGRVLLGGSFTKIGGLERVGLARLAPTGVGIQNLTVSADRTTAAWPQGGTSAELAAVTFEYSPDLTNWIPLGNGRRVNGAWTITGQQFPATDNFYLRARGIAATSSGASSSIYESVRQFNYNAPNYAVPMADPTSGTIAGSVNGAGATFATDAFTGIAIGSIPGSMTAAGIPSHPTGANIDPARIVRARLTNISTRGRVTADTPIILGFAVTGTSSQTVLLRGAGPTLARFGVANVAAKPVLRLFDGNGKVLLENSGWTAATADTMNRTGAFPFDAGSSDTAAVVTLAPGTYSMHVLSGDAAGGIALAEIYDASTAEQMSSGRIINLSSRGVAGVGGEAFIGGLVIAGDTTRNLLVRGIGPTLNRYGVTNVLGDPTVSVYDAQNRLIATNDNWSNTTPEGFLSATTAALVSASSETGAFGLDVGSKDSALLITLSPGAYTVIINGPPEATGAAMIEVYER